MRSVVSLSPGLAAASAAAADPAEDVDQRGVEFERYRVHAETGAPLDTSGFTAAPEAGRAALGQPGRTIQNAGRTITIAEVPPPDALWHVPGAAFSVSVTPVGCTVVQRTGHTVSQSDKQLMIARDKADRDVPIAGGTHEMRRVQTPRTHREFGHRAVRRTVSGRCRLSAVAWNLNWISGGTGEQPERACELPKREGNR